MEMAVAIGVSEVIVMAAGAGCAAGQDEYDLAGGLQERPVAIVKCSTVGLEVPAESEIVIEPVTVEQAKIARQAYRDYGRGSGHAANLNFGDCFSYALARAKREPILFKGDDFGHTDLRSAVEG